MWVNDILREEGMIEAALQKAEKNYKNEMMVAARNMKNAGVPIELIASSFSLSKEEITNL